MIIPLALAVVAAIMYALSGHIDKYLISKTVKNADYRALILVSTFVSGGLMTIIYLFVCNFDLRFDVSGMMVLFLNAVISVLALVFWFKALNREDVTIITIMLQLIPVFTLLLAPLLLKGQDISLVQLIGGVVIVLAALMVTYEPSKKKFSKNRLITLLLMTFASLAYALWEVLERFVNQSHDFNQTTMWSNIMLLLVGVIIIMFSKTYRRSFRKMMKSNGAKVVGLNLLNELLYSFGGVAATYAGTMVSVALVSFVTSGVQPFATMMLGIMITKLFPKVEKETITKEDIIKRLVAISMCVVGLACIGFG